MSFSALRVRQNQTPSLALRLLPKAHRDFDTITVFFVPPPTMLDAAEAPDASRGTIRSKTAPDDAMADFDKAIKLNPRYAAAYYNRGVLHYFGKRPQQAIDDLNMTLHFDSSFEKAYFTRALAYEDKGEIGRSISDLKQFLQRTTDTHLADLARQKLKQLTGN